MPVNAQGRTLVIAEKSVGFSEAATPGDVPWRELGVDLVLECSGKFRTPEATMAFS